jgi:hypothetical protein
MVAEVVTDYSQLNAPRLDIDERIARFDPPDDLDLAESQSIQTRHFYAIQACIAHQLASGDKTWDTLRYNTNIRIPVENYLLDESTGVTTYASWAYHRQAKIYILGHAPRAADGTSKVIYELLGIALPRAEDSDEEQKQDSEEGDQVGQQNQDDNQAEQQGDGKGDQSAESDEDEDRRPIDTTDLLRPLLTSASKRKTPTKAAKAPTEADKRRKLQEELFASWKRRSAAFSAAASVAGGASTGHGVPPTGPATAAAAPATTAGFVSPSRSDYETLIQLQMLNSSGHGGGGDRKKQPKPADIPKKLLESIDYQSTNTIAFFEELEDYFDVDNIDDKYRVQVLLWCTKGTIRKNMRDMRAAGTATTYDDFKTWLIDTNTQPGEKSEVYKRLRNFYQQERRFRIYLNELTERYKDCQKFGITITEWQFRDILTTNMSNSLQARLMEMPEYESMPLRDLAAKAEAIETSLLKAGTLENSRGRIRNNVATLDETLDERIDARLAAYENGGGKKKGDGKGKGSTHSSEKKKKNKGKGKGKGKKDKGTGGRGTTGKLPQNVYCKATVKALYTEDEWAARMELTRSGGNPKSRPELYRKDRYQNRYVCWTCRTFGEHTMDQCPKW